MGGQLAGGAPAAHLGDPAPEWEALPVYEPLVDVGVPAVPDVIAHVAHAGLEEQVDLDPVAIGLSQRELVEVAPHPVLSGLQRADHRVVGRVVVRRGVAARARVAAADVSAGQAAPEADPVLSGAGALLADGIGDRRPVRAYVLDVLAGRHGATIPARRCRPP